LFVWFIKERGLVPDSLFSQTDLKESILKSFDPESKETNYYKAVLQNLFFATLNQTHGERQFRNEGQHQNTTTLLRYENKLSSPQDFIRSLEATTPFLNGGLFECLDHPHPTKTGPQGGRVIIYEDGFSDRKDNPLTLPDFLFFGAKRFDDLSGEHSFGLASKKNAEVRGLIDILDSYKFTIVENTPIDQEIALDPELLGQVFENLLASYNEETKTTARKQTGSFYTPRAIVDYMVDESLKAHFSRCLTEKAGMTEDDTKAGLDLLFAYTEKEAPFSDNETAILIEAIDNCKILDPACGSGAFPMGTLQKLVFILSKLDRHNKKWQQRQIDAALTIPDSSARDAAITAIEKDFAENADDYGRKLYLIENCLYGVDVQSIATQVSKLRFFISLIVDQNVDRKKPNFGVRPLPNLESKFVTANTLIKIEKPEHDRFIGHSNLFERTEVAGLQAELKAVRHNLFSAKTPRTKEKYRTRDKELREAIADELKKNGWESESAANLAHWDPYDQNASAPYFDPEWMFGESKFDIVIGNPPYIQIQKFPAEQKDIWQKQKFATYAATADIYCLFYERGADLLKQGGHLCYITSNKWMRAGYGEQLRDFLASKVNTTAVLDFGMAQNFGAATTYTCVTSLAKQPSAHRTLSCYASDTAAAMSEPADYFARNAVPLTDLDGGPWVVLPPERYAIKVKVEAQGVPLEKWKLQINYGIKTGFNDAFYLTQEQRDSFVAEDPRCADHLVPLLRGRYIDRYASSWDETWMIATFPALDMNFTALPAPIRKHLEEHRPSLEPKPRSWKGANWDGRKAGDYEWFETQDVISYHSDFTKPKIMYPNMTKFLPFYFDDRNSYFTNDKGFIINSQAESLPYLVAFLNSYLFRCCFRDNFPELMGNTYEVRKIFVDKIPVKKPTASEVSLFERLVPLIQLAKAQGQTAPAAFLEDLIDACVMECYFREHMAERDLLFHDTVAPHLAAYAPEASAAQQRDFLTHLHQTLNDPSHPIRNRLLRLTADSPDLLAIIKQEGKV
jgi:type I restriction-modification system DNA methylase subunit